MITPTIWSAFARSYDRVLSRWDPYLELVGLAERHLRACRRVLDLGCGTGVLAERLASAGAEVEGLDSNPAMLEFARERQFLGRERFVPRLGDALTLPYVDGSFDGVAANNVIFYVADPRRMLREVRRVLRPGGTFAVSGPRPDPDLDLLERETVREFIRKGIVDEVRTDLEHFVACSKALKRDGMPNVYQLSQILVLLGETGFGEPVEAVDSLYFGQTWFVATR